MCVFILVCQDSFEFFFVFGFRMKLGTTNFHLPIARDTRLHWAAKKTLFFFFSLGSCKDYHYFLGAYKSMAIEPQWRSSIARMGITWMGWGDIHVSYVCTTALCVYIWVYVVTSLIRLKTRCDAMMIMRRERRCDSVLYTVYIHRKIEFRRELRKKASTSKIRHPP